MQEAFSRAWTLNDVNLLGDALARVFVYPGNSDRPKTVMSFKAVLHVVD
jgi:hypothetical protein